MTNHSKNILKLARRLADCDLTQLRYQEPPQILTVSEAVVDRTQTPNIIFSIFVLLTLKNVENYFYLSIVTFISLMTT